MKKYFSSIQKILLVFMLIFTLTFSACAYSNGPSESFDGMSYIGNIDGFKATYRPRVLSCWKIITVIFHKIFY